ncbi:MAG: hypothetical protein AB1758_15815 [Candidatus Eremiobacterota bacterium]
MTNAVDTLLLADAKEPRRLEAVARYHQLLEKIDLKEMAQNLQKRMADRGLLFGERLLCPFLRPHFVGREQLELLKNAVRDVVGAMNVLAPRIVASPELQERLGLTEEEKKLTAIDPGYPELSVSSRLDSFLLGGKLRFVEYNAECPAGIGYGDILMESFLASRVMKAFVEEYPVKPMYCRARLLKALIDSYRKWGGQDQPVIAVVDYEGLPTRHEFEILRRYFVAEGYETVVCDPRKLEYANGKLQHEGKAINLVYRRLLVTEYLEKFDQAKPVFEAYRDRAICLVNNFRSKFLHKKAIFALITDPELQEGMSSEQLYAVYTHVPWTRRVAQGRTTDPEGKKVDLVPWIKENRRQLVMKPNDEYGGKGIYVGWELTEADWDKAIDDALAHWYLVQTRVEVAREHFPTFDGENVHWGEYTVDLDPFVFGGEVEGLLTRLSATALCNVTAGGGVSPTFVLD